MLCCLLGGALLTALVGATRRARSRPVAPALVVVGGAAAGMFAVEALISFLVPLGAMRAVAPLLPQVGLLVVPALLVLAAVAETAAPAPARRGG